ncbi:MAG TPA: hypothetical protein VFU22_16640 [Roseiflexaceae bacterium]|nr:hypothetical protein [Roseiflexaceae bacterium]
MRTLPKPCAWAGMTFMLVIGSIHLIVSPHAFDDAAYKGILFLIGMIGAFMAAMGIQEGALMRGWVLGTLVAGATAAGFIANGTVGLPGLNANPQVWQEPLAIIALACEVLMLVVAFWAYEATRHHARRLAGA